MTRRLHISAAPCLGLITAAWLAFAPAAAAEETYQGTTIDERLTVALTVNADAVAAWLPEGWVSSPPAQGQFQGANLLVVGVDRLLQLDATGEPAGGGSFRAVALLAPAKNIATDEVAPMVLRIYSAHDSAGPYKNNVRAQVTRETTSSGADIGARASRDTWTVTAPDGTLSLTVAYEGAVPVPRALESRPRSADDPSHVKIYRVQQIVDIVMSTIAGIERVSEQELSVGIGELGAMFDGTESVVAIAVIPSYARQTFTP